MTCRLFFLYSFFISPFLALTEGILQWTLHGIRPAAVHLCIRVSAHTLILRYCIALALYHLICGNWEYVSAVKFLQRIFQWPYLIHRRLQTPYGNIALGTHWLRQWASYQIRINCGLRLRLECRERFPRHRSQRKPLVSDPDMYHGMCVTHVPWCMSDSLTSGGGKNVPGIPGACATRNFTYLARGLLPVARHIIIKSVSWHSPESDFPRSTYELNPLTCVEDHTFRITSN